MLIRPMYINEYETLYWTIKYYRLEYTSIFSMNIFIFEIMNCMPVLKMWSHAKE